MALILQAPWILDETDAEPEPGGGAFDYRALSLKVLKADMRRCTYDSSTVLSTTFSTPAFYAAEDRAPKHKRETSRDSEPGAPRGVIGVRLLVGLSSKRPFCARSTWLRYPGEVQHGVRTAA